jgi:hypothetical protein
MSWSRDLSNASQRAATRQVTIALLILVAVRLLLVLTLDVEQWSDLAWYYNRAAELVATGRYAEAGVPTAFWPVGYPAFLAWVMHLTEVSPRTGQLANIALSAAAALLMYHWCCLRFNAPEAGALAALLLALYPNHMGYSVGLYSEPLYVLLLLLLFIVMTHVTATRTIAAGLVAGLATLVKAQTLLLAPVLFFVLAWRAWSAASMQRALAHAMLGTVTMLVVVLPWTWRNATVMEAPVLVSTNGGMSLLSGNNPSMTTRLNEDFNDQDPLVKAVGFTVVDQVAADRRARAAAWQWIADNPARFIALMPKKLFRLWAPDGETEWLFQNGYAGYEKTRTIFRSVRVANQLFYAALLLGFALAWRHWAVRHDPSAWAVPLMIVYFSALSMVFSGQSRYHAPLMPFIVVYAALVLQKALQRRQTVAGAQRLPPHHG